MKLELNLKELNSLYMAVSNQLKIAKKEAMEYPSEFFNNQLILAEELVEKVQDALYAECDAFDSEVDECRLKPSLFKFDKMAEELDLEEQIEILEAEREYYASKGDWEYCELISEKIEDVQDKIDELFNNW